MEIIGIIPAGGKATRLGKLPCSKEIYPLFRKKTAGEGRSEIKVISEYLINSYRIAGINNIFFIIRRGKWDIPDYYGDGKDRGVNISYLIMNLPYGIPFTLDQAFPFTRNKYVALGYPDIIVEPEDAYIRIKERILKTKSDIVLGLFPIDKYRSWDMIEFNRQGKINNIIIKQERQDLKYGWTIAMWNPSFWEFMHKYIQDIICRGGDGKVITDGRIHRELYPGDIFMDAIKAGLKAETVIFEKGRCLDIGTPENMAEVFT